MKSYVAALCQAIQSSFWCTVPVCSLCLLIGSKTIKFGHADCSDILKFWKVLAHKVRPQYVFTTITGT